MVRLIGIDGDKGAGKDTLAEILIKQFGFTRLPFAQPLKSILSQVLFIAPEMFEDRVLKDSPFKVPMLLTQYHIKMLLDELELRGVKITDQAIKECMKFAGITLVSPRHLMQVFGTDMVRTHIGYDTWVNLWAKEQAKYDKVVAPDARFPNERDAITVRMGKNVLVKRPELNNADSHISENNHGQDSDYDAIVTNTVSKQALQSDFAMWYTVIKDK